MQKKKDPLMLIIYGCIALFILYFAAALGAAVDKYQTVDGKPDFMAISNNLDKSLMDTQYLELKIKDKDSYCLKFIGGTAAGMVIYVLYKSTQKKRLHRKGEEHGSAKWATVKEAKTLADSGKDSKTPIKLPLISENGKPLYGKPDLITKIIQKLKKEKISEKIPICAVVDNNIILSKEVKMSLNTRQHRENLNVLIVGGSGSGKTRFYVKPNIMQLNTSFVVTDPKGEILQSTMKLLIEAGYDIKVFNLINMANSNNYNPFDYVYNFDGTLNQQNVIKMIDVFMKNTKGEGDKDDFWAMSAVKLITAVTLLLFEESSYEMKFDDFCCEIPETRNRDNLNFSAVCDKLRKISYGEDDDIEYKSELTKDFDKLEAFYKENRAESPEPLALRYYKEFLIFPKETGQSVVATANTRTQMFNLSEVENLTCTDTIHLETLGDKKTALFIIISATDGTFNFLAAMMYAQMFDTLANRANFKYGGTLPVHVRCLMDEFANLGQIPDFDKVIAFVRSMGMSLNVIVQNIAQLKAKYEKTWEVITGNCDSFLFLGGKESSTLKEVSEMLGKETIDVVGQNRTKGRQSSTSENNSILGRELMLPNELSTMKITNCILMIRAFNPFFCEKFPIEKHSNYKFLEDFDKNNAYDVRKIKVKTKNEIEKEKAERNTLKCKNTDNTNDKEVSEKLGNVKSEVKNQICEKIIENNKRSLERDGEVMTFETDYDDVPDNYGVFDDNVNETYGDTSSLSSENTPFQNKEPHFPNELSEMKNENAESFFENEERVGIVAISNGKEVTPSDNDEDLGGAVNLLQNRDKHFENELSAMTEENIPKSFEDSGIVLLNAQNALNSDFLDDDLMLYEN